MATDKGIAIPPQAPQLQPKAKAEVKIDKTAQQNILSYSRALLTEHRKNSEELINKMTAIDQAYARYKATGEDSTLECDIFEKDDITPPIVVSQVDSVVAYLAEVFLSGTPLFPVVSNPSKRKWAEQLETLFDDHARIGGYTRQFLIWLRDCTKYNYGAIECSWKSINQFSVLSDFTEKGVNGRSVKKDKKFFNAIKRLDPYNVVRDPDVAPGDVASSGDYAGYVENLSYIKMKSMLLKMGAEGTVLNFNECLNTENKNTAVYTSNNYRQPPQISDYIQARKKDSTVDWEAYMTGGGTSRQNKSSGKRFEVFTFYARIIPSEMSISVPQKGTPQIWKFVTVNDKYVVFAERIVSAYDYLPIFFGQPLEDGLDYQTQSIAEGEIPFQEGAAKLYNIRFSAARRAVADRALYLPELIKSSDANAKVASAKIPVNIPAMSNKKLDDAYKQIPFDMRGTETTMSDAREMVAFSQQLHGINNAKQGQFQKGNKSVTEWNDTMGASDGRSRLYALCLEAQVFAPMKDFMVLNIYQYGDNVTIVSQRNGETVDINIDELRKQVLAFRVADGYTPKSKMASTDAITAGMNMIGTSPLLQQSLGQMLPQMFAHFMQLMGVRGLDEYMPQQQAVPQDPNAAAAMLQTQPQSGLPAPALPDPMA